MKFKISDKIVFYRLPLLHKMSHTTHILTSSTWSFPLDGVVLSRVVKILNNTSNLVSEESITSKSSTYFKNHVFQYQVPQNASISLDNLLLQKYIIFSSVRNPIISGSNTHNTIHKHTLLLLYWRYITSRTFEISTLKVYPI